MGLENKKSKYVPIYIVITYSLLTIYLFEFGVVDFRVHDKFLLYFFLFFAHLGIILGYFCGMRSKISVRKDDLQEGKVLLRVIFKYAFIVYLVSFIPAFMVGSNTYSFSISDLLSRIQVGLTDSAVLYNANRYAEKASGIWRIINWCLVLTGFIRWTFFPLAVYLWSELKLYHKFFFFVFAFFFLASYLTTGTTAGVFTVSFITIIPFVMKAHRKKIYHNEINDKTKKNKKRRRIIVVSVIIAVWASLWLFSSNMESRLGWKNISGDWSSFPWNLIPISMRSAVYWLTGYIAQGYGALSYCIDLPFTSTFGLGSSWFLIQNFSGLLNINILEYTYLGKAEEFGFGAYHNWHTVYVWLANDVSFVGVPIVLFILFYLMAQSWRDYLDRNDPYAFIFMTIMGFFCLYISANNTVFTHADTLFAFWVTLYLWKKFGKRYSYE